MKNDKNSSEKSSGFGLWDKEDSIYDIYDKEDVGNYVVIVGKHTGAGYLVKRIGGVALLLPFQGMSYSKPYAQYKMFNDGRHQKVSMEDSKITPLTEQELMEFIDYENHMLKKAWDKDQKESEKGKRRAR